jgi:hypothetical protein
MPFALDGWSKLTTTLERHRTCSRRVKRSTELKLKLKLGGVVWWWSDAEVKGWKKRWKGRGALW